MGIRENQIKMEESKEKGRMLPVFFVAIAFAFLFASGVLYLQKIQATEEIQRFSEAIVVNKLQLEEFDQEYLLRKEEYQELLDQKLKREREGMKENYLNLDGSKDTLYQIGLGYYAMESAFRYYLLESYSSYFEEFPEILYSKTLDGHFYYAVVKDSKKTMAFIYEITFPVERVSFQVLEETVIREE